MKNAFKLLTWLWNRRKTRSIRIPKGGIALILKNREDYIFLVDALCDAETYTGIDYPSVLMNPETQIFNN